MKTKILLTALLVAFFSIVSTLFVYSHINGIENAKQSLPDQKNVPFGNTTPATFTSAKVSEEPVDFSYAAEQTVHSVVHVRVRSTVSMDDQFDNPFFQFFNGNNMRQQPRIVTGFGSGVIISPDGFIVTNGHVVDGADSIRVTLNNNKTYLASLIGKDPDTDIALIKIKAEDLPAIKFGDSDNLKIGEWVLAVGNPFNLTSTVTAGIVSAKGRSLNLEGGYKLESFIQTDAALNMGNSGGALVNTNGELVGITSAIVSPTGTYAGNSFAIPVNLVKKTVNDLKQFGKAQRGIMGITIREVDSDLAESAKLDNVSGVYIANVTPGGAADEAGIKPKDVIIKIDDRNIGSTSDLLETVGEHRPGDRIKITFYRNGKEESSSAKLKNVDGNTAVVRENNGETVFGSKLSPITSRDKEKFSLDSGAKITSIGDGKLKDLGIKNGTIITSVNGKRVKNASDIREASSDGEFISSIDGIQSNGTRFSYQFKN